MTVTPRIASFIISGIIAGLVSTQLLEASLPVAPREQVFGTPAVANAAVADVRDARKSNRPGTDPAMTASTADSVAFPEPTAGQTTEPFSPEKAYELDEPAPSQPMGCEAAARLIVDPTLALLVGRCFA
jgi:hypothetical protein